MKMSWFSKEQIIGILKEHEAGIKAKELSRKHGMSDSTFYKWKAKFSVMEISEARRLRDLDGLLVKKWTRPSTDLGILIGEIYGPQETFIRLQARSSEAGIDQRFAA